MPQLLPDSREELQRRVLELSGLLEVARTLVAARDVSTAVRQYLLSTVGVVGSMSGAVFRYDEPSGRLTLVVERGLHGSDWPNAVLSADEVSFLEDADAREGVTVRPAPEHPQARAFVRDQGEWLATYDAEAIVPLIGRSGLWGVALFGPRLLGEEYGESELGILATSTQMAATALENLSYQADDDSGRGARRGGSTESGREAVLAAPSTVDLATLREEYPALEEIVGESDSLAIAMREIVQVAPTRCPVLILGETGTGKELAARAVHRMSPRSKGPFEVVNCGAIPQELIESELFGHLKGSFTGATRDRRGAFELAHGGTLFLDEIGELPAGAQTRLLRVLQEGQMRRVGDERSIHVDVRVVAATNRNILEEVENGRFRADLYYRIGVFTVSLPPLRERVGDMAILVGALAKRIADETGRPAPQFSRSVIRRLSEYSFPGNIRELQNVLTVLLLRSPPEGPTLDDLEAVLASAAGERSGETTTQMPAVFAQSAAEPPSGKRDAESTGRWVLDQLRKSDFNLSQTERNLARLRKSPAGRAAAPVADRSSLTYYLQGECFKAFAESKFDLESAAERVAEMTDLQSRARARLLGFLDFVAEVADDHDDPKAAQSACRDRLPKLPAHYLPYLDSIAAAYVQGEWTAEKK